MKRNSHLKKIIVFVLFVYGTPMHTTVVYAETHLDETRLGETLKHFKKWGSKA